MKINSCKILLTVFFLGVAFGDSGKKIDHLGIKDGISMSAITGLVQDENGYIWIGTQEGLNRFDGYDFKVFKKEMGNKNSLQSNYIASMALDKKGNIWISNGGNGVDRFDIKTQTVTRYQYEYGSKTSLPSNRIFDILPDSKGNVWFGSASSGLCKYIYEEDKFIVYEADGKENSLTGNRITSLFEDEDGTIWVSTRDDGINVYDEKTDSFRKIEIDKSFCRNVSSILKNGNKLFIATYFNGINVVDLDTKKTEKILLNKTAKRKNEQPEVNFLKLDSQNNLWVNTFSSGTFKFELSTKEVTHYSRSAKHKISNNYISSFLEDNNGIIWIGTLGDGIFLLKPNEKKIVNYTGEPDKKNSLSGSSVFGVYQDKEKVLWAGTQGHGLNRINRTTGKIKLLTCVPSDKTTLSHNEVYCITGDDEGYIWVGTQFGLNKLNSKTLKVKRYFHVPEKFDTENSSLSNNTITSLDIDKENNLWIGTEYGGVNKLSADRKTFKVYYNILGDDESISSNKIGAVFVDSEGFVWIGTWFNGLNKLNPATGKVKRYLYQEGDKYSLQSNSVNVITEDSDGMIWLGGEEGLIKFDKSTEKFFSYTVENGLPNNTIYGIKEDNFGDLWITTNRGIARFNRASEKFKVYDDADGFQGLEFNTSSSFKTEDGELIFGGYKGISAFYPENIKDINYSTNIVITDLKLGNKSLGIGSKVDGKIIIDKNISYIDEINLPYFENNISVNYSSINYFIPEKVKYSYKMENLDEDWIYAEDRRFVSYNKIPPGNYIFKVRSTNSEGLWNQQEKILKINILPPFWMTLKFKFTATVVILLIIYLLYKYKTQAAREQRKRLENLVKERTKELVQINKTKDKFFSIIAHDLRNPFVALLGFSQILYEESDDMTTGEIKEITSNLRKSVRSLYGLLNNLLSWSTLQTGQLQIKKQKINITDLINQNIDLYKANAERKEIKIVTKISDEVFAFADENVINTVLRNLISNAVKFTEKNGEIIIGVSQKSSTVEVVVSDNGVGLTAEEISDILNLKDYHSMPGTNNEKGTGLGLSLCREMLEKCDCRFVVESEKGKGSSFKFYLPAVNS
ncbi:MAG: two-component regulator propeller domain-containing protein [Rhodothermaceae bacterium]